MTRCSDDSRAHDEPLRATASRVDRWLLVEHRGAWGPDAPPTSRMARTAVQAVTGAAAAAGARLLLVRRHERPAPPGRWVFAVSSRPGEERVLARHVGSDDELLGLVPPCTGEVPEGWQRHDRRLWLVCTHGRHDLCCAVRGRPVARALQEAAPDDVWEASHLGGDRFAATVVLLPEGHYFGRVGAEEAPGLVAAVADGRLPVERWRGRSSLPLPTQAAQAFARERLELDGLDDLALVRQTGAGPDRWVVVLAGPAGDVAVEVRYDRTGEPRPLTCGAEPKVAPRFVLTALGPE
ncbi:MAG: sucrase ferredoxin [Mycobacteriales bacterium]